MLELRPNCELCDKDLPPDSTEACICSYECTFCRECVEHVLHNVCPNCGGGLTSRPIRPRLTHRPKTSLAFQAASEKRIHTDYEREQIDEFVDKLKHIPPQQR